MDCLCRCLRCAENTTIDQITSQRVPGLYVSRATFARHNASPSKAKQPKRGREAPLRDTPPDKPIAPPPPNPVAVYPPSHPPKPSDHPRTPNSVDPPGNEDSDALSCQRLQSIERILQAYRQKANAFDQNLPTIRFDSAAPFTETPPALQAPLNRIYISHVEDTHNFIADLDSISVTNLPGVRERRKAAIREIQDHLEHLNDILVAAWQKNILEQREKAFSNNPHADVIDCDKYFDNAARLKQLPSAFLASILTVVILHLIPGLAQNHSNFLLGALRIIITMACTTYVKQCFRQHKIQAALPDPITIINGDNQPWYHDIRTAMKELRLNPDLVHYACCRTCYSCYQLKDGQYPAFCTFKETPGSTECGRPLTHVDANGKSVPIQTYAYQPISSFIARLLSRPGISEQMEATTKPWKSRPSRCWDFFGAKAFRNFLGPDGKLFLEKPAGEERLIFSLFVDWFNPFGNKISGKVKSVGGIYMVCLNLPIHLRYRVENVYVVGLIPGEPTTHHINHLLRPLVIDLKKLWTKGMWLTKTALYSAGCLLRAAVLPLIADGPATRKVSGFAGVTAAKFCNFCNQTKDQLNDFDVSSWIPRNKQSHMAAATAWRDAQTEGDRGKLWKQDYIRWSELSELPYWDATKFVVVDPMHTLFLNMVQLHVRQFWGVDEQEKQGRSGVAPHSPEEQVMNIQRAVNALNRLNANELKGLRRTYLEVLASANSVPLSPEDKKSIPSLIKALIEWRSKLPVGHVVAIPQPHFAAAVDLSKAANPKVLLDKQLLGEIRADMEKTTLPSWVNRAPKNFGSPRHGKLSADHWRTLLTINLVITLVRIWGSPGSTPRNRELLGNFMELVTLIVYATARTTTENQIQIVESMLLNYYRSFTKLKPDFNLHPSHHMSFHLPYCLRMFGPVHGWWAYAFERYNGIIQRLNHNNHFACMTTTWMQSFCQAANLKAFLDVVPGMGSMLQQLKDLFDKHYKSEFRGSLLSDLLVAESLQETSQSAEWSPNKAATVLENQLYRLLATHLNQDSHLTRYVTTFTDQRPNHVLLDPYVQDHSFVHAKGVTFSSSTNVSNSLVIFRPSSDSVLRAGQIQRIFAHTRPALNGDSIREFFFVMKEFTPLNDTEAAQDPYRQFPLLDVKLYRDELSSSMTVVRTENIISHCASYPFQLKQSNRQCRVILSLDRNLVVSHLPNPEIAVQLARNRT